MPIAQPKINRPERREESIKEIRPVIFRSRIDSVVEQNRENKGPSTASDTPARFSMIEQNYEKLENQVFDYEILKQHPKSKFFT